MATLSIGIGHLTIGVHNHHHSEAGTRQGAGVPSRFYRFASAAQKPADKYPDHKNNADWWMFRI